MTDDIERKAIQEVETWCVLCHKPTPERFTVINGWYCCGGLEIETCSYEVQQELENEGS